MQKKIKVGAVSYLNTKPLIYGFEHGMMKEKVDLIIDYPSKIATMLLNDEIDLGLIPVAVIPEMKEYYVISDYCIGSVGEVASVCLFSEVPLNEIKTILLDYQSRTSVALLKILVRDYWKLNVQYKETSESYQSKISGKTAGLVIGDRALQQRKISPYIFDLGSEWKTFTNLPFVFAAWISNKKLEEGFIKKFNTTTSNGLQHFDTIVANTYFRNYDLQVYYKQNIDFSFDIKKKQALKLFLHYLSGT